MKLLKTTIQPISNFMTPLKGDTLFGQICWAIRFKFGKERLEELLSSYENEPFLVVSDAFASGYLPKPTMPSLLLSEDKEQKKENRKKIWLTYDELVNAEYQEARTNEEIGYNFKNDNVVKNSINYKTFTTQGDNFAPYSMEEMFFSSCDIYFLINKNFSKDELFLALELVSQMGYGKKSTIGKGRFTFDDLKEFDVDITSNTFIALSPFSLTDLKASNVFYEPFVRFGKSGANRATTNAFKKPILLADRGAVLVFDEKIDLKYVGKAIKSVSSYADIVHQGYSIVLPIKEINYEQ
jgi:CRISPR-associated protein Csm4